ncbi:unnamed protein product [Symbiodinium sp. CCMP2592]|nr:unnamed protein product [Symbiodinium sp. CCMP2592]
MEVEDALHNLESESIVRQPGHDYVVRGRFEMKVLDEELPELKFADQQVSFVKVDVEGFECHVWKGAKKLLKQRPRLIQSEVWGTMQGCTPTEYLKLFRDAGYRAKKDVRCRADASWSGPKRAAAIEDYFMCVIEMPGKNESSGAGAKKRTIWPSQGGSKKP